MERRTVKIRSSLAKAIDHVVETAKDPTTNDARFRSRADLVEQACVEFLKRLKREAGKA